MSGWGTLLFADGFGHYNQLPQKWTFAFAGTSISPDAKRGTGVAGCVFQATEGGITKSLAYQSTVVIGGAWQINRGDGVFTGSLYTLSAPVLGGGTQTLATVFVENDGSISIYAGTNTGNLAGNTGLLSTPFYFVSGVPFYIEAQIALGSGSTIGVTASLAVNGVTYLTGVTASGTATADELVCQGALGNMHGFAGGASGSGSITYLTDVYVNSGAGFRGDIQVGPYIVPISDGTIQWSESSGGPPSYSLVNEVPPDGDSTYVYDYVVDDQDTFSLSTVASLVGEIQAVHLCLFMRKDNEGSRGVKPNVNGSAPAGAPAANLSDSYYYFTYPMDTVPGGGAWDVATVNSTTFGVEVFS